MTVEANKFVNIDGVMQLKTGDIVRHKSGGKAHVVTAVYGDRATAVTTVDITHASEWEVMRPAPNTEPAGAPRSLGGHGALPYLRR